MMGTFILNINTGRHHRHRRLPSSLSSQEATCVDVPASLFSILAQETLPISILEARVLHSALQTATPRVARVAVVMPHSNTSESAQKVDLLRSSSNFRMHTFTPIVLPVTARRFDAVYSIFGANHRSTGGVDRHARLLSTSISRSGVVVARIFLRHRKYRDAIIGAFERYFANVRFGFVNYSLFCCVHTTLLMRFVWHDLRLLSSPLSRTGEWWQYGQLFLIAREPRRVKK